MQETAHDILFKRIDEIDTLDKFIDWVRNLSVVAENEDVEVENPSTPVYLECLSAFMEASKHTTPMDVGGGSISLKSMARALMSALTYE